MRAAAASTSWCHRARTRPRSSRATTFSTRPASTSCSASAPSILTPPGPRRWSTPCGSTRTPNATTRHRRVVVSPDGRAWTGDQPRGLDYWVRLHDIYQSEIVDERDRFYLAMLKQLGIEKGKPFEPDERVAAILTAATAAGELMAQANTFAKRFDGSRYWPDRSWDTAIVLGNSAQRGEHHDELLERASWFYEAVSFSEAMKSQTPGVGQAYLGSYSDAAGDWLDGAKAYTLHVPADPPAKLFWSATVYDASTRCLIDNEQQRGDRGSRDPDLVVNPDGSVDLYFGPTAPAGGESNWVQTIPGPTLVLLLSPLRSPRDVLRPHLEARRHHCHLRTRDLPAHRRVQA